MLDIDEFKKKLDKKSRLMGIDPGRKRVGIAISDENKIIATPYKTLIKNKYSAPIKLNYLKKNVFYSQTDAPLGWEESLKHLNKKLNGKIYQ